MVASASFGEWLAGGALVALIIILLALGGIGRWRGGNFP